MLYVYINNLLLAKHNSDRSFLYKYLEENGQIACYFSPALFFSNSIIMYHFKKIECNECKHFYRRIFFMKLYEHFNEILWKRLWNKFRTVSPKRYFVSTQDSSYELIIFSNCAENFGNSTIKKEENQISLSKKWFINWSY